MAEQAESVTVGPDVDRAAHDAAMKALQDAERAPEAAEPAKEPAKPAAEPPPSPAKAEPAAQPDPKLEPPRARGESRARQLANQIRRERKFREEQQAHKADLADLQQFRGLLANAGTPEGKARILQALHFTQEDLTAIAEGKAPKTDPAADALREVTALRTEIAKRDETAKEERAKGEVTARAELVAEVKGDIAAVVKAAPEKYELLAAYPRRQEEVFDLMVEHFKKTGEEMSYEAACDKVEADITADFEAKVLKSKRFSSRLAPPAATPAPSGRSLSQVGDGITVSQRSLSESDYDARAMKILRDGEGG